MADLVDELRAYAQGEARSGIGRKRRQLFEKAAAEIERLRRADSEYEFLVRNDALEEAAKIVQNCLPRNKMLGQRIADNIRAEKAEAERDDYFGKVVKLGMKIARAEKAEAENERLRAEIEQLRLK